MLYNDNLISKLQAIADDLERRKEKPPEILLKLINYCKTDVNSGNFLAGEFGRLFQECITILWNLANGGYIFPGETAEANSFFRIINNLEESIINAKDLPDDYNEIVLGKANPEYFLRRHKVLCVGLSNIDQRARKLNVAPIFEVRGDGPYLAVSLASNSNIYGFVPRFGLEIDDHNFGLYAFPILFECEGYKQGMKHQAILKSPAFFEHKENEEWHFQEKGGLTLRETSGTRNEGGNAAPIGQQKPTTADLELSGQFRKVIELYNLNLAGLQLDKEKHIAMMEQFREILSEHSKISLHTDPTFEKYAGDEFYVKFSNTYPSGISYIAFRYNEVPNHYILLIGISANFADLRNRFLGSLFDLPDQLKEGGNFRALINKESFAQLSLPAIISVDTQSYKVRVLQKGSYMIRKHVFIDYPGQKIFTDLRSAWNNYFNLGDGLFNSNGMQQYLSRLNPRYRVLPGESIGLGDDVVAVDISDNSNKLCLLPNFTAYAKAVSNFFILDVGSRLSRISSIERVAVIIKDTSGHYRLIVPGIIK